MLEEWTVLVKRIVVATSVGHETLKEKLGLRGGENRGVDCTPDLWLSANLFIHLNIILEMKCLICGFGFI